MSKVKVLGIQMLAAGHKRDNLAKALNLIDQSVALYGTPDFVVLPEYCYHVPVPGDVEEAAESIPGEYSESMSAKAKSLGVYLLAGSFPEKAAAGKYCNTSLLFDRQGQTIGTYRKTHLFDAMAYKESDSVQPGDSLTLAETEFGPVGMMVCYDLRFPEIPRTLALQGAKILFAPAAFPSGAVLPARTDHWDLLVQSMALLNLCYTVGVNQFGQHNTDYYFGRSMIVDPWGVPLAQAQPGEGTVFGVLDLDQIDAVRAKMPVFAQRRSELYRL